MKGIAPLVIVLAIALIGGGTYAVVNRSVLKEYFQAGDKPTQAQFENMIDSTVNMQDDKQSSGSTEQNPKEEVKAGATVTAQSAVKAKVLLEDQKEFKLDTEQSVTFRWTPLVPKPQEPVTYRIKVWQLMQGQNGTQAMRENKPIVTKDVDTVTEATIAGLYTGPCKPPYLCDFVWSVEVAADAAIRGAGE